MIVRRMAPSEGAWLRNSGELNELRRQMQSLMGGMEAAFLGSTGAGVFPAVNVTQDENNLYVRAELPGMKQEDFDLSIENNVITLRGERRFEKSDESDNYHRVERSYGAFTRSFTLPQTVSGEEAQAEYNNGVLRVTLPKREEAKSRRIEITGGSRSTSKTIDTTADTKAKASSGS